MTEAATILDGWEHWDFEPMPWGWLINEFAPLPKRIFEKKTVSLDGRGFLHIHSTNTKPAQKTADAP